MSYLTYKAPLKLEAFQYSFVTAKLATGGGWIMPADIATLKNLGITCVIDVQELPDDQAVLAAAGIAYLWNPIADDGQSKPVSWFQSSLDIALPALVPKAGKVYAHCAAGVNRGPSTLYCIMRALGLSAVDAEALIRKYRPVVNLAYKTDADNAIRLLGYPSL